MEIFSREKWIRSKTTCMPYYPLSRGISEIFVKLKGSGGKRERERVKKTKISLNDQACLKVPDNGVDSDIDGWEHRCHHMQGHVGMNSTRCHLSPVRRRPRSYS